MSIGTIIQDEVLGMKWLNRLIGSLLNACGLDTSEKIGGSVQFFIYDVIKIMVLLGVLKPKEAGQAIPLSMLLLIIGSLAMAGALSGTGAGDLIGGLIAGLVRKVNNNYVIGFLFFFFPFALAQLMSNRGAMLLFFPIACAAANQLGGDPRGLLILIEAGALTAFMTPMPTAAVPYMMEYGGYDQRDLIRGEWLFALIACVLSVGWIMTIMPVL